MDHNANELVHFACSLADESGHIIKKYFRNNFDISTKADNTQVTEVDIKVEKKLTNLIKKKFDNHSVIGEEFSNEISTEMKNFQWVIDPIDGTKAFINGKPTFGTLIALYDGATPVLGIINQPILNERWVGCRNKTTFNGMTVETSKKVDISKANLEATSPQMFSKNSYKKFLNLASTVNSVSWGSDCYAYGMLANGQIDIVCEDGLKYHDFAALVPIIQWSGGIITDWEGQELNHNSQGKVIASSNEEIHKKALEFLNK